MGKKGKKGGKGGGEGSQQPGPSGDGQPPQQPQQQPPQQPGGGGKKKKGGQQPQAPRQDPTAVTPTAVSPTAVSPTAVTPTAVSPTGPSEEDFPSLGAAGGSGARRGGPQQRGPQQQKGPAPQQQQGVPQAYGPRGGAQQGVRPQQQPFQQQGVRPQQQPFQQQGVRPQQQPFQQQQGPVQPRAPQPAAPRQAPQQQRPPQGPPPAQQAARPLRQDSGEKKPSPPRSSPEQLAGGVKAMSIGYEVAIPKRVDRPKVEKKGPRFMVETNHLPLRIANPNMIVVHYDVSVVPEKPFRFYRPAVNSVIKKLFPNRFPAFDGKKNLFAYPELPFTKELVETVEVYDEERQGMREVTVTIKYASRVDLSSIGEYLRCGSSQNAPQDAIQVLDIVLRQPAANRFVTVGRSFFTAPRGRVISLGDGLDLWYGFYQSAIIGWKPYLNIDVAHKGFPSPVSCLEVIVNVTQCRQDDLGNPHFKLDPYQEKMFLDQIKGLKVVQTIPNQNIRRTYKVIGLGDPPKSNSFICEDKTTGKKSKLTVEEYFLNAYKLRLRYPHLPCLKAGSQDKPVALPIELCRVVEGQVTLRKMNEIQTRTMVKEAAVDTERRKAKIMQSINEVRFNSDPCLKEFGLTVAENFTKVEARIIAPPTVDYKDRSNKQVQVSCAKSGSEAAPITKVHVDKGVWRIYNVKFFNSVDIPKWAVLNASRRVRDNELKTLTDGLTRNGRECGINISNDFQVVSCDNPRQIEEYFNKYKKDGTKLIIVVLPDRGVSYAQIKKMAELNVGVLTQCLKTATVQKRCNPATFVNILQKINAKLNGTNHIISPHFWPTFFHEPVMVVGADVTHPAPDQSFVPSIAAVAASHDPRAFKYNMIWNLQPPRVEVIDDLQNIMKNQLLFFYRNTGHKPRKILFYRDGVSEGQFRSILDKELRSIRAACSSLEKDYQPPITFLVVQKRHHTRFFPSAKDADGRNKNVPAGTVVDTEITHPTELDFYLVSHASIQGTARPTKYHLLWDDNNMSEKELEEITYYLCHLFTRCTRAVSYPAPTYYAHLAAFRARSYTEVEGNQRLNLDDLALEQKRRTINPEIVKNNPMFFV